MKYSICSACLLTVTLAIPAIATKPDAFVGTWRFRRDRSKNEITYKFLAVGEGKFQTDNGVGVGPVLPVDGSLHESPLGGTVSLKKVDGHTYIYTFKRDTLYKRVITLDGDTMKWAEDQTLDTGKHETFESTWARTGHGDGLAGEWRRTGEVDPNEEKRTYAIRSIPNGLVFKNSDSEHEDYTLFDGNEHADTSLNTFKGSTYTATRMDEHSYREVTRRNGEVIATAICKLSDDENAISCIGTDNHGKTFVGVSERVSR